MSVKTVVPYLKVVKQAAPAVAQDIVVVTPGLELWRVISIDFTLTTDANVANRLISIKADDGTDTFFAANATNAQTAGTAIEYGAFTGGANGGGAGVVQRIPLPFAGLWLNPGWRLRTSTSAMQVGDQYSAMVLLVEAYPISHDIEWQPTNDRAVYERS